MPGQNRVPEDQKDKVYKAQVKELTRKALTPKAPKVNSNNKGGRG